VSYFHRSTAAMAPTGLRWLLLLAIIFAGVGVHGQDEDGSGDAGDDGGSGDEGVDEAWEYVEFLKNDITEKIENILQVTLYEAREKNSLTVLDETVAQTMEQVMEVRENLLKRIKDLRKGEIEIDESQNIKQEEMLSEFRMEIMTILLKLVDKDAASVEKLKLISQDLLKFKMTISNEIMRILMLPQNSGPSPRPIGDCSQCEPIKNITTKVGNLIACAEEEEEEETEDVPEASGDAVDVGSGDSCPPPEMYVMELIAINEDIDESIKNLYNALIATVEDEEREKLREDLDDNKETREQVDEMIDKLMTEKDPEKIKKAIKRGLRSIQNKLESKLSECQLEFCAGTKGGCDSCAADVLYDALAKMDEYKSVFNNTDDDEAKKEFVRTDMIKFINDYNSMNRDILITKATDGKLEECDEDKLEVITMTKGPMWMLVNTTIFSEIVELEAMVDAMIESLNLKLAQYCGPIDRPDRPGPGIEGPNCQWEEYQQTKEYLNKVDEVIQDALFKVEDDSAQMTALLGFVDIQGLFDKRVKKLFEDELVCPDEVTTIKKDYMTQLNTCMAQFMNTKRKFTDMSRLDRISCTKELRNSMETRMADLLKTELENSLNEIDTGDGGSGEIVEAA